MIFTYTCIQVKARWSTEWNGCFCFQMEAYYILGGKSNFTKSQDK